MPAHRPGHKRHELDPQTGLQCYRRRSPSAARWLRATELAGLGPTGRNAESNRSSTAASQPARASRALAPGRRPTSNSPNAFIRPQRLRRSRQIPIGQNLRSSSRGFVPWRLSDAGPGASGCACDGRHPKPYTGAEVHPVSTLQDYGITLVARPSGIRRQNAHASPYLETVSIQPRI